MEHQRRFWENGKAQKSDKKFKADLSEAEKKNLMNPEIWYLLERG